MGSKQPGGLRRTPVPGQHSLSIDCKRVEKGVPCWGGGRYEDLKLACNPQRKYRGVAVENQFYLSVAKEQLAGKHISH